MERRSVVLSRRGNLLNGASQLSLAKARMILLPIVIGTGVALSGITLLPNDAMAAAVVCAPQVADGTQNISANETCTGSGDFIDYAAAPANADATVTWTGGTITTPAAKNGIIINNGTRAITVTTNTGSTITAASNGISVFGTTGAISINNSSNITSTGGVGIRANISANSTNTITVLNSGNIVATGGSGIEAFGNLTVGNVTTGTTGAVSVGTAASRISGTVSGGFAANAAQGIWAGGLGNVSVFTATGSAIIGTSTGGGSWGIRAQSSGNGTVVVDTLGTVSATRAGHPGDYDRNRYGYRHDGRCRYGH
jgi:hypothetical protein